MCKIIFRISLLLTLLFACVCCNEVETDLQIADVPIEYYSSDYVAHPFTFSNALKSDKWKMMDSNQRNELFQIPTKELKQMNEMDLAMTCVFFYPRRFDILASEHPMTIFDKTKEINNGFEKLFSMSQAGEALLTLLKNYELLQNVGNSEKVAGSSLSTNTISRLHLSYICCMLVSKDFSEKMSPSLQLSVQCEIDRRISMQKGNPSSLQDLNILYAVRARLLANNHTLSEEEQNQIDYFIYNTLLFEEPCSDFIDLIDSIIKRYE